MPDYLLEVIDRFDNGVYRRVLTNDELDIHRLEQKAESGGLRTNVVRLDSIAGTEKWLDEQIALAANG